MKVVRTEYQIDKGKLSDDIVGYFLLLHHTAADADDPIGIRLFTGF